MIGYIICCLFRQKWLLDNLGAEVLENGGCDKLQSLLGGEVKMFSTDSITLKIKDASLTEFVQSLVHYTSTHSFIY